MSMIFLTILWSWLANNYSLKISKAATIKNSNSCKHVSAHLLHTCEVIGWCAPWSTFKESPLVLQLQLQLREVDLANAIQLEQKADACIPKLLLKCLVALNRQVMQLDDVGTHLVALHGFYQMCRRHLWPTLVSKVHSCHKCHRRTNMVRRHNLQGI